VQIKGQDEAKLTGQGLSIDLNANTYEILQNVRSLQRSPGKSDLSIQSETLLIFPSSDKAVFSRKVQVVGKDFKLHGDRLTVDFQKSSNENSTFAAQKLLIDAGPKNPRGNIHADLSSMKITSNGLAIDLDTTGPGGVHRIEAVGQAVAQTNDGIEMRAQSLVSETVDGKNRIHMKDEVSITAGGRKGTCEEAFYYPESGDIVLATVATVSNESQILKGERIRFSTKNSDVTVERARGSVNKKELGLR
jgi:lipopolysaccharide export system protein LptA